MSERVQHPPRLERARALEQLCLQERGRAELPRERRGAKDRSSVEPIADRLARGRHVVEGNGQAGIHRADRTSAGRASLDTFRAPTRTDLRARLTPSGREVGFPEVDAST